MTRPSESKKWEAWHYCVAVEGLFVWMARSEKVIRSEVRNGLHRFSELLNKLKLFGFWCIWWLLSLLLYSVWIRRFALVNSNIPCEIHCHYTCLSLLWLSDAFHSGLFESPANGCDWEPAAVCPLVSPPGLGKPHQKGSKKYWMPGLQEGLSGSLADGSHFVLSLFFFSLFLFFEAPV